MRVRIRDIQAGRRDIRILDPDGHLGKDPQLIAEAKKALADGAEVIVDLTGIRSIDKKGIDNLRRVRAMCVHAGRLLKVIAKKKMRHTICAEAAGDHFLFYLDEEEAVGSYAHR